MKFTAYIAIFSVLLSSFSYAGSSARLLNAVAKKTPAKAQNVPPQPPRFAPQANYNLEFEKKNLSGQGSSASSTSSQSPSGSSTSQVSSGASAGDLSPFPNGKSPTLKNNLIGQSNSNSGTGSGGSSSGDGGRTPPPGGGGGGGGPTGDGLEDKPLWIPMCFFFDSKFDEKVARERIKQVVDDWAGCGIAVDVYSATIADGYANNDPKSLNKAAEFHCPWKNISGADVKYGATQSHPDSIEASDRMCDKPHEIKEKEEGKKPWNVTGCATMARGVSIVDKDGDGFTSSHEEGHAVAQNSPLENYGEHGIVKTNAGRGLQLVNSPQDKTKVQKEAPEGSEANEGYTAEGCQALRSGANDNSQRQVKYNPKAFESYYYIENEPTLRADFVKLEQPKFFIPTKATVNEPPPTKGDVVRGEPREIRSSDGSVGSGTADPAHKKGSSIASNSNRKGNGSSSTESGDSDPSSSGKSTRGDDNSPLPTGSAVGGGTGGPAAENQTIVANDNNKNAENKNPILNNNFFTGGESNASFSGGNSSSSSVSSGSSGGSVVSSGSIGKSSKTSTEDDFLAKNEDKEKPSGGASSKTGRTQARVGYDEPPPLASREPASTNKASSSGSSQRSAPINYTADQRKPRRGGI